MRCGICTYTNKCRARGICKTCQPCREPHVSRTVYNTASTKSRRYSARIDMWRSYSPPHAYSHHQSQTRLQKKSAAPNRQFSHASKILGHCLVLITHSQEKTWNHGDLGIEGPFVTSKCSWWRLDDMRRHATHKHTHAGRYRFDNDNR
jgi:hypothetical protein